MLMDQCAHPDGLRDKGTQDRPEHAWDSVAIQGQPADRSWEGLGWEKCVLCLTEGLCQAGRRVGEADKEI